MLSILLTVSRIGTIFEGWVKSLSFQVKIWFKKKLNTRAGGSREKGGREKEFLQVKFHYQKSPLSVHLPHLCKQGQKEQDSWSSTGKLDNMGGGSPPCTLTTKSVRTLRTCTFNWPGDVWPAGRKMQPVRWIQQHISMSARTDFAEFCFLTFPVPQQPKMTAGILLLEASLS